MNIRSGVGLRASLTSAAGLYVPWISGDTNTTVSIGSSNASNNQSALVVNSYSATAINTQSVGGIALLASSDTYTPVASIQNKAATNNITYTMLLLRTNVNSGAAPSSVVPAAGFGANIAIQLDSSTVATRDAVSLVAAWKTATDASRTAYFSIQAVNNGSATLTERARFGGAISTNTSASNYVNEIPGNTIIAGHMFSSGAIEVGGLDGSGSRVGLIDFHAQDGSDYDFRMLRSAGANSDMNFSQSGTGHIVFNAIGGGSFYFQNNGTSKFNITGAGFIGIGATADPNAYVYIQAPNSNWPFYIKNTSLEHLLSIDWKGNFSIYGGHTGSGKLYVNAGNTIDDNIQFYMKTTSGLLAIRVIDSSSNIIMQLTNAGALSAVSYTNTSDIRIKKNIRELTLQKAEDILLRLKPIIFDYKDDHAFNQPGFVAQDIQQILPDIVTDTEGVLGYQPTSLIPILVSVVQGLIIQNKDLEQRLLKLEVKKHV